MVKLRLQLTPRQQVTSPNDLPSVSWVGVVHKGSGGVCKVFRNSVQRGGGGGRGISQEDIIKCCLCFVPYYASR